MDFEKMKCDEWLETDGLGGFASGTVSGIRTRRYHALLLAATKPPAGRVVLVNGFDASVETEAGIFPLSSQMYNPNVVHPDGAQRIESFKADPWPQWVYGLSDGTKIQFELFVPNGAAVVALSWRMLGPGKIANLSIRPFFSGRDYHSMHHENASFRFEPEMKGDRVLWRPYEVIPGIVTLHNGEYRHRPDWYRNFLYEQERSRGLDASEDLAAPGLFYWNLVKGEARIIFAAAGRANDLLSEKHPADAVFTGIRAAELRRRKTFYPRSSAQPTLIWSGAAKERPSSPAIHGSRIGAATLLSRFADSASRRKGWMTRATFFFSGRKSSPQACCRTDFRTRAICRNTIRWTHRCGTSLASMNSWKP